MLKDTVALNEKASRLNSLFFSRRVIVIGINAPSQKKEEINAKRQKDAKKT